MRYFLIWLGVFGICCAYIPGMGPKAYHEGEILEVYANKLQSPKNQLPHQYHYAYPFCRPAPTIKTESADRLNLGQLLMGERHEFTNFDFRMMVNETCKFLCRGEVGRNMTGPLQKLNSDLVLKLMQRLIDDDYVVRLNLDNLPVVMRGNSKDGSSVFQIGYPFGIRWEENYYVHNHFRFKVLYHQPTTVPDLAELEYKEDAYQVVGFEVLPYSTRDNKDGICQIKNTYPASLQQLDTEPITFTYDVFYEYSSQNWATRWDPLFDGGKGRKDIQWISISISVMLTLTLTLIVGGILLKTVHNDFVRYNGLEDEGDMLNESGWKLVHADVFRTPPRAELLCIMNGTGAQILWTLLSTLEIAIFGLVSPSHRGALLTSLVCMWVALSSVSGYVSAKLYNSMQGRNRRTVVLGSAFLFTGAVFSIFVGLNILLAVKKSTAAVPFTTLALIIFLWFGLSVPLVLLGSFLGFKKKKHEWPCRTNAIPREIPASRLSKSSKFHCMLAALVPFGVVLIQLIFVLNSLWQNQVYYMFGFMFIVFILGLLASAEVSIALTYLKLTSEDYRWWWYSFVNTAFTGFYVFAFCLTFFLRQTDAEISNHLTSLTLFLSYNAVFSISFCLMEGYIGLTASLWFVRKIYSSIRID
uniref:Transmembrane 9 superfamily member n=1 Tax=Rhodosorus marinus TaxID=101924 RepID=A0A7S2ZBR5_9RHOD|mmetsp:Transcript_12411/g.50810  ORF Transcript_12411/g.50810 Transcript_12411/m.50810 type:complete len:640 (+) Transcript_12411:406-2325(+)